MNLAHVSRRTLEGHSVVAIAGDLDFATVAAVTDRLEDVLAETSRPLVVDLTETTFLDSAGISLLYELHGAARARGQPLRLVVPRDNLVSRALALTGAERSFSIQPTVDAAVADLGRRDG